MRRAVTLAATLWLASLADSSACDIRVDYQPPPWQSQIDKAPIVFIGHVTKIRPDKPGWSDRVFLSVETPVVGEPGPTFEATQVADGNCGIKFEVGDWVIFAGDDELDPTVFLSDPLTRDQKVKLGYLKRKLAKAAKAAEGHKNEQSR